MQLIFVSNNIEGKVVLYEMQSLVLTLVIFVFHGFIDMFNSSLTLPFHKRIMEC